MKPALRFALALFALVAAAQLAEAADKYKEAYIASLKGSLEIPKVNTKATGKSELYLYDSYAILKVWLNNIKDLQVVHVHFTGVGKKNPTGSGGPVLWVAPFEPFKTYNPYLTIKGTLYAEIKFTGADLQGSDYPANATPADKLKTFYTWAKNSQLYINAHTKKYAGGEIRGNYAKKK